ncbi:hypothetical protein [Sinorhizobium meliloti]|uniref:hypothetical protein n=1 Tax=Rhizobium meliloti TaxID=382 RepID=UPI002380719E|nr:hypothetical protein [Sinorhizobium meliloti]MDE3819701.1 hypothetical protein [Sinorhizobium meliloti]
MRLWMPIRERQLDGIISGSVRMTRRARGLAASVDATADGHNRITCKALPNRCGLDGYRDDAFSRAAGHRADLHGRRGSTRLVR